MPQVGETVYIASKLGSKEDEVRGLKLELERRGYVIPYDWTTKPVKKPFVENAEAAHEAAEAMARAVMECDVLIVLCAPNGIGYHIETGGALVAGIIMEFIRRAPSKRIYVVGPDNDRSVFYFHKSVMRLTDVTALLEQL